jgi:ammonia channel protein AmtB
MDLRVGFLLLQGLLLLLNLFFLQMLLIPIWEINKLPLSVIHESPRWLPAIFALVPAIAIPIVLGAALRRHKLRAQESFLIFLFCIVFSVVVDPGTM